MLITPLQVYVKNNGQGSGKKILYFCIRLDYGGKRVVEHLYDKVKMKRYKNKVNSNVIEAEKLQQPVRITTVTDGILSGRKGFYLIRTEGGFQIERPEVFEQDYEELK